MFGQGSEAAPKVCPQAAASAVQELASGTYNKLGHTSRSQLDPERVEILDGKSDHLSITLLAYVNLNLFRVPEEKI